MKIINKLTGLFSGFVLGIMRLVDKIYVLVDLI